MSNLILVVAALIERNGKYLIAKRQTGDPSLRGYWELPGGKVKPGETEKFAIEREINEELGIIVRATKLVGSNTHEYPQKVITLRLYECVFVSGELILSDHSEYAWAESSNFSQYNFAPADIPLIKKIEELCR